MNEEDFQLYRSIEVEWIKAEALKELDEELDAEEKLTIKRPISNTFLFLIYSILGLFLVAFVYFYVNHPLLLYNFFEAPLLKPMILASPGAYGIYMKRKEKKEMEATVKRLEAKYYP